MTAGECKEFEEACERLKAIKRACYVTKVRTYRTNQED